ncbi:MAG: hypothetical protein ACJATV_001258 [Granulosicoccus sp.]|jgi:hypothetical protein
MPARNHLNPFSQKTSIIAILLPLTFIIPSCAKDGIDFAIKSLTCLF